MKATIASTRPISRYTTHTMRSPFVLSLLILLGACTQAPTKPEPLACPAAPAVQACPVCPVCPPAKPPPETALYVPASFESLPGWAGAELVPSLRVFLASCPRAGALSQACDIARALPSQDEATARQFFETMFQPFELVSSDGPQTGLITGYYEPVIRGSRKPSRSYRYPVLGVPDDLITVDLASVVPDVRGLRLRGRIVGHKLVPYYSRGEIDSLAQSLPAPALAWAADPVELFFLQIQGSGQIQFENGERMRVGYADQNGYPFRSLGRYLVDKGELTLDQASMQGIKAWAAANPAKLQEALNQNPSYVFFRELPPSPSPDQGPPGALGVPLTPGYSLAVDRRFVPLGAPVYLATTYPLSDQALERLAVAQDTGGAIHGAVRADFFWGTGPEAGALAGRMRQQGMMWLLWPRDAPLPQPPPPRPDPAAVDQP